MLETTTFSIHACRFLYSAASGYFILSGGLAGLYYLRFREMFAGRHFILCLTLLVYAMTSVVYTYGVPTPFWNRVLISTIYVMGPTIFSIYAEMIAQLLRAKPRWLPPLQIPLRILPGAVILDFLIWLGTGGSFLFVEDPNPNVRNWLMNLVAANLTLQPTILLVLIPASFSVVAISLLFLIRYRGRLRREPFLKYGIIIVFLTQIHDISVSTFDIPYVFPLAFSGYILEVIRFNMSLVEGYLIHNDTMRARLKESLMSFAQVRLSKQILHDVKSIRRNILYKLETLGLSDPMNEVLTREIDRLKVYEAGDIKNPKEEIRLSEIVDTTVALFAKDFAENRIDVEISIPRNVRIRASRNDMLIVLINLIQNSMESISKLPEKWIKFTAEDHQDSIRLEVCDSGKISSDERAQIFRAGYSSKGISRGLGLNIVQESLAANNALVTLNPDTVHTTFQITFQKTCH